MENMENLKKLAYGAFENVSFDPQNRAARFISDFENEVAKIKGLCEKYGVNPERFLKKHYDLSTAYLSSSSRCASWAITGPAKFPVKTMEKRTNSAHNHLDRLCSFLENVEKILIKITRKKETQDDKKAKWAAQIEALKSKQDMMKSVNALIRKGKIKEAEELAGGKLPQDFMGRIGFPAYELRNNLANIKRLEAQVAQIDAARATKAESGFSFEGGRVEFDAEEIRYNIFFDEKPSEDLRSRLKSRGFKWSPKRGAWTRGAKTIRIEVIKELLK